MGQVKAYRSRSRTGCVTCKKRRVKCDETRPICLRCNKLKISCEYQGLSLTWEDEANQRGITFGRSLEARAKNNRNLKVVKNEVDHKSIVKRRLQYLYINVTPSEFDLLLNGKQISLDNKNADLYFTNFFEEKLIPILKINNSASIKYDAFDFIFDNITPLSFEDIFLESFAPFPITQLVNVPEPSIEQCNFALSQLERDLVTYFIEKIGPDCVCCEIKPNNSLNSYIAPELNPYLYLIIPLAFKSPLVMKTIVATSATQLALLGFKEYREIAQKYLIEVTSEIIKLIEMKSDNDGWDDVFAIIIMLCFVEISANCNNSWLALLNYAKNVLKESSKVKEKILSPLGKFFVRYFISHEVMGETAWVHDNSHSNTIMIEDDPFIEDLKKDYDIKIDLVFGCSPYLVSLIHRISVIGQCLDDMELETSDKSLYTEEILKHAQETEQMLQCLNQQLPNNSEIYFDDNARKNISLIAEIKRLGALLYLYAVIFMNTPLESQTTLDPFNCTQKIMHLTKNLPDCYMSLLWPIFVIGLVTADDEDVRWFVLDNLRQMERKRKLKTVQAAREIIINVWKEKDLGTTPVQWKDMIKGKATTISLA